MECRAKNSGVTRRLVASSATAFAPFSQNSATLRPPCSSGHAHPGQSNPWRWFSRVNVAAVRTGPICSSPRCSDTITALTPAASCSTPETTTSCSSIPASMFFSGWRRVDITPG
jgi:hypothetical protein